MTTKTLVAQFDAWVLKTERRQLAVFRTACDKVIERLDMTAPVDTGFLRAGRQVLLNAPPPPAIEKASQAGAAAALSLGGPPSYAGIIANATLDDRVTVAYVAEYAPMQEFGTAHMPPKAWVRGAIMQWPQFVAEATAEAKAAVR